MRAPDAVDELRCTARQLPRACAPLPGETISSYLRRLASANRIDPEALRIVITGDHRNAARPRLAVLSRLSGYSESTLLRALPELTPSSPAVSGKRPAWPAGPGCVLCNATRGAAGHAQVWHAPEDVLCLRHRRWTTGRDRIGHQPDLREQPEILTAHRTYRRLTRAHGRETVRSAYLQAARVIDEWRDLGPYNYTQTDGFNRRISRFLGPGWRIRVDSPVAAAARYPQVVALTRLLVSPYWMDLASRDHIAAGRPDKERRKLAAGAVSEYRRSMLAAGQLPDAGVPSHLAGEIAAGYLLADGPSLRIFLDEVRRAVEPDYRWSPFPRKLRLDDPDAESVDPLVELISDRVQAERARLAGFPGPVRTAQGDYRD